jgi:hypothetical protein
MLLHERLKSYLGQPIAILCARYWYRGILREVGEDHVLITNPRAVEVTGSAQADRPEREDIIPSDLMVRIDFMEIVCQPTWVYHEMDKESIEKTEAAKKKAEEDRKTGKKAAPAPAPQPARARR